MAKQAASVVHVRLPPAVLDKLKERATAQGSTVHAEVIRAVEASVAGDQDVEVEEIRKATLAMLDASHLGLGDAMPIDWTLRQFKFAMGKLFAALEVKEPSDQERLYTELSVNKVITEMCSDRDTDLAAVGRALGMAEGAGQ
jgi:hypothetical protein